MGFFDFVYNFKLFNVGNEVFKDFFIFLNDCFIYIEGVGLELYDMIVFDSESIRVIVLIWCGFDDGGWEFVVGEFVVEIFCFEFEVVVMKKVVYFIVSFDV